MRTAAIPRPDPFGGCSVDHNGSVEERRWINHYQPQTLVTGTVLAYIQGFFALLTLSLVWLAIAAALGFGGYGIANDKRWGYGLAVGGAILQLLIAVGWLLDSGLGLGVMLSLLFAGALVALLLHPESREYQRIWFS